MKRLRSLAPLVLLPLLVGCTTQLSVQPLPDKLKQPAPQGTVYFLPAAEFGIEHERELLQCPVGAELLRDWLREEVLALHALGDNLDGIAGAEEPLTLQEILDRLKISQEDWNLLAPLVNQHFERKTDGWHLPSKNLLPLQRDLVRRALDKGFQDYESLQPAEAQALLGELDSLPWNTIKDQLGKVAAARLEGRELKVAHRSTFNPRYYPDHNHGYAISHLDLASGLKETTLTVDKYPNGTLKEINPSITDQTGDVIGSTVRGALRIAAALNGFSLPAAAAEAVSEAADPAAMPETDSNQDARAPRPLSAFLEENGLCKPETLKDMEELARLRKNLNPTIRSINAKQREIDAAQEVLDKTEADLKAAEEVLKGMEDDDPKRPDQVKKVDDLKKKKKDDEKALKALKDAKTALETRNKKDLARITALHKQYTETTVQTFRPPTTNPRQERVSGDREARDEWFQNISSYCGSSTNPCYPSSNTSSPSLPQPLSAHVAAYLPPGVAKLLSEKDKVKTEIDEGKSQSHLVYREPAHGDLLTCHSAACLDSSGNLAARQETIVTTLPTAFPQLGALATLPLQNGSFQNNSIVARFDEAGSLTHFEYETNARALAAAKTFETAASDIDGFAKAQRKARQSALQAEEDAIVSDKEKAIAQLELEMAQDCLEAYRRGEPVDEDCREAGDAEDAGDTDDAGDDDAGDDDGGDDDAGDDDGGN